MKTWLEKRSSCFVCALVVGILCVAPTGWIVKSYFEAEAYTRLTGKEVTTWDAMFLDLRVIEPAKADDS